MEQIQPGKRTILPEHSWLTSLQTQAETTSIESSVTNMADGSYTIPDFQSEPQLKSIPRESDTSSHTSSAASSTQSASQAPSTIQPQGGQPINNSSPTVRRKGTPRFNSSLRSPTANQSHPRFRFSKSVRRRYKAAVKNVPHPPSIRTFLIDESQATNIPEQPSLTVSSGSQRKARAYPLANQEDSGFNQTTFHSTLDHTLIPTATEPRTAPAQNVPAQAEESTVPAQPTPRQEEQLEQPRPVSSQVSDHSSANLTTTHVTLSSSEGEHNETQLEQPILHPPPREPTQPPLVPQPGTDKDQLMTLEQAFDTKHVSYSNYRTTHNYTADSSRDFNEMEIVRDDPVAQARDAQRHNDSQHLLNLPNLPQGPGMINDQTPLQRNPPAAQPRSAHQPSIRPAQSHQFPRVSNGPPYASRRQAHDIHNQFLDAMHDQSTHYQIHDVTSADLPPSTSSPEFLALQKQLHDLTLRGKEKQHTQPPNSRRSTSASRGTDTTNKVKQQTEAELALQHSAARIDLQAGEIYKQNCNNLASNKNFVNIINDRIDKLVQDVPQQIHAGTISQKHATDNLNQQMKDTNKKLDHLVKLQRKKKASRSSSTSSLSTTTDSDTTSEDEETQHPSKRQKRSSDKRSRSAHPSSTSGTQPRSTMYPNSHLDHPSSNPGVGQASRIHNPLDPFNQYVMPPYPYPDYQGPRTDPLRESFSASLRNYVPLSSTRPDDYVPPMQYHNSAHLPHESIYGDQLTPFRNGPGYNAETKPSTHYHPQARSFEDGTSNASPTWPFKPPKIDPKQTKKDNKNTKLHIKAKNFINAMDFTFQPWTYFQAYDRPGDPRREQILTNIRNNLNDRMTEYYRYTLIRIKQKQWLDPNDPITAALQRLRGIFNHDRQALEQIEHHLDKYRLRHSTYSQKMLKSRGRLEAPRFGNVSFAEHAHSLRTIEKINNSNVKDMRTILQRHLIQMESLNLTEEAMKSALSFILQGHPRNVFDFHHRRSLQSIIDVLCDTFSTAHSHVDVIRNYESMVRKPTDTPRAFALALKMAYSRDEFMSDPIIFQNARDIFLTKKLFENIGPITKIYVRKEYYRKIERSGYANADFVLDEIEANERVYNDWPASKAPPNIHSPSLTQEPVRINNTFCQTDEISPFQTHEDFLQFHTADAPTSSNDIPSLYQEENFEPDPISADIKQFLTEESEALLNKIITDHDHETSPQHF